MDTTFVTIYTTDDPFRAIHHFSFLLLLTMAAARRTFTPVLLFPLTVNVLVLLDISKE